MIKSEEITINGIEFKIGYAIDKEFAGYICEMKKGARDMVFCLPMKITAN